MAKALTLLGLLVLAGCGASTTDRALSGGAIGAGSDFLLGGTTGALVGGDAGAAAGALTDSSDVNLGRRSGAAEGRATILTRARTEAAGTQPPRTAFDLPKR